MPENTGGPYVSLATFCESVLTEQSGNISVIRAMQRLPVAVYPGQAPDLVVAPPVGICLVISLQSGAAQGRERVTLRQWLPSGLRGQEQLFDVLFEGQERGVNLVINPLVIQNPLEGLYWFEILVGERSLTRTPLRIIYQQAQMLGQTFGQTQG